MFDFQDLFQWDRFITPTIIKTFYWLVIGLIVLFGISGSIREAPSPTVIARSDSDEAIHIATSR